MYIKVNISGTSSWKAAKEVYVKVSGAWKSVKEGYIKVGGAWKKFWSSGTLKPEKPIEIAQTTNTTTYLITLTGTNYAWTPGPPILTYFFEWSTNGGTTWTQLSTGTAQNPAYGSSNTYTYSLTTSNVSANVLNTYRFRIHATYGSQVTDSSATTTVQGPTNITNLATGTLLPTSVPLTWAASTGAGRYMVYYGTTSSPSTLYAGTSGLSTTVAGLTANTLYYFKVVPITGLTNSTGYAGNDSNIVSATTPADLANTAIPTISGTLKEGQTITVSNGTWNTTPDSYTYQWLYYDQPSAGFEGYLPITGATSSSYAIPLNYRDTTPGGQYIRARVNAVKSGYTTTSAYSTGQIVAYDVTVPDAPTGLSVTDIGTNRPYNNGQIYLSWTAPANNGGSALTSYRIDRSTDNTTFTTLATITPVSGVLATSYSNINLASNTTYYYRIYAVNSVGASTSFASGSAKATTVPSSPTVGTASSSNTYILVTYTANADGGKPINTFTATSSPGSLTGSTSSGAIQVSNVVHNTAYTFTVTATNANGTSTASASSNTAYGVNIGSVSVLSSSSTINTITLNFTKATNSTGTRAYLSGGLDGTTSGTSYTFAALSSSTSYNLGLAGTDTVNGTLYIGPITTGSYSTSALSAVTVNSYPSISGTGASGSTISFASGSYNNASTITKTLMVSTSTSFSTTSGSKGSTSPYTVTTFDANPPAYYFATLDTVVGTNGLTYYFWSGGYSGSSATIPAGSGSILSYLPAVAPSSSNTSATISATSLQVGGVLSTTISSTATTPLTYSVQMQWSPNNSTWYNQGTAGTSSSMSYTFTSGDVPGQYFRFAITVTNSAGSYSFNTSSVGPTISITPPSSSNTSATASATSLGVGGVLSTSVTSTATTPLTYSIQMQYSPDNSAWYNQGSAGTSSSMSYTFTSGDVPGQYFRFAITVTNSAGSYSFNTNVIGPTGTAPSSPTGLVNSYSAGPTWTGSWTASTGTSPITYYWTLYQSQTNGGAITKTYTGSTTSTSFSKTANSIDGFWAYFAVYASNNFGTSSTVTSGWA